MKLRSLYVLVALFAAVTALSAPTFDVIRATQAGREGDSVVVYIALKQENLSLAPTVALSITPRLVADGDSLEFPSIHVLGRMVYYRQIRHGDVDFISDDDEVIWEKHRYRPYYYLRRIAYEPWMDRAHVTLTIQETDACDDVLNAEDKVSQPAYGRQVQAAPTIEWKKRSEVGRMSIIFPLDRTEYHPELYHNAEEMQKIRNSIDIVLGDTANHLQHVHMKGWASPEGPYWNNVRLARGRVDTLAKHVAEYYQFPKDMVTTENEPEDWEGLIDSIRLADPRNLPHKAELLEIATRKGLKPDTRERIMRTTYPKDFDYLLEHCLPLLRHSDYRIDYLRRERIEHPGEVDTVWTMPQLRTVHEPVRTVYRRHPVLFALKTNLLFDAILAPNVEVEVPLGRQNRWSLMAEYWTPWYVWHHNSRAYEIQVWGLELRRWKGLCREREPLLTGTFWGYYAAFGRYDFEWGSIGNQGETFSVGVSYGHSWVLGNRWNLELSGSIGACYGPLRHYHGEFNDTHLIWRHNGTAFYAGPTKLKVSLAWMIGPKAKKGGRL